MKNQILTTTYVFDEQNAIWSRPGYVGILYSDGDEAELRIAGIIDQAFDITVLSPELREHCTDWPTLYHLFNTRVNILRPFAPELKGDILEIGAGCGAITRYLGECGANILALEGSPRRAAIARSRTRDLENVTVLAEKFDQFQCDHRFDLITLIGVLEYANIFTTGEKPAITMLQRIKSLLKPEGKLIIAIENQLGLKYFAGAPEDHLGQPMYGIEGRYRTDQPQTFGRAILTGLLEDTGFATVEFLAPFPDYKFPVSILTKEGLSSTNFDGAALAWQSARRDLQLPPSTNFSLELAWPEVFKNGLALDMANSFLVVASPSHQQLVKPGVLGYHYTTDRAPQYCKETVFEHTDGNMIAVNYHMLSSKRCDTADQIIQFRYPQKAAYTKGTALSLEFVKIVTRDGWSIGEVGAFIQRYISMLSIIAEQKGYGACVSHLTDKLPADFFDITPQNIIIRHTGQPVVIDAEWSMNGDIELGWLLLRSLLPIIESVCFAANSTRQTFSRGSFVKSALEAAGYPLTDEDFRRFIKLESAVYQQVTGRASQEFLDQWPEQPLPANAVSGLDEQIADLEQTIFERDRQIATISQAHLRINARVTAIENSTAWRMTSPLRRALTHKPILRKIGRRTAKLIWWTRKLQLGRKLREWNARDITPVEIPHFAPPTDDYCLAVPLAYPVDNWKSAPGVAVICHMYYTEMADEFKRYLMRIPFPFDLFITTDSQEKRSTIENHFRQWNRGEKEIRVAPNQGRDIAPKLIACRDVYDKYEFILHIHTKKSPHYELLCGWRSYLLETLLGSEKIVESIFELFRSDPKLGMIAPQHFEAVRHSVGWGWNFQNAEKFARKLDIKISLNGRLDFPSGSMFWARSAALKPLLDYQLSLDEFPSEADQEDGTLSHVIERLYFFVCERAGYRWMKVGQPSLMGRTERVKDVQNRNELLNFIKNAQYELLKFRKSRLLRSAFTTSKYSSVGRKVEMDRLVYERSNYKMLDFSQFQHELKLHIEKKESLIDFDDDFYLNANLDVAADVANGVLSCGFIHYCLKGQDEGRIWSDNQLKRRFSISPSFPDGFNAPVHLRPLPQSNIDLSRLPRSPEPFLLIFFSHLQDDLFFAGYTAFFQDFSPLFGKFSKIVLSVESEEFNPRLTKQYSDRIEVIQERELGRLKYQPDLIIAFNNQLSTKAKQICNNPDRTIYYCQDFESGFFPYGAEYVEAEKAIASSHNIIVSTELLRSFLVDRQLLRHQHVFTTSPKIESFVVPPEKTKRLFFYFRPEAFHRRNLPQTVMETVQNFCRKHVGYEIFMVGSVDTRYSYKINETPVYVINKLPKKDYIQLISSCDVVVSLIYSAHPGVIAFQAAASGIPTVTNVFERRDANLLKQISENILPYDPVRENLLELVEEALTMPKGKKSFNELLYSGPQAQSLNDFIDSVLSSK